MTIDKHQKLDVFIDKKAKPKPKPWFFSQTCLNRLIMEILEP